MRCFSLANRVSGPIALVLLAAIASATCAPLAFAEGSIADAVKDAVHGDVKALRRGPLLIHGNYCGVGNRPSTAPIDALDTACMHHDACTRTGKLPGCACDDALRVEATAVAEDPATPADIKALALATAAGMTVLVCK